MTAAVARPPLFNHLVASRPESDRTSLPATVLSVMLHGAAIGAVVLLGAKVGQEISPPEKVTYMTLPTPFAPPSNPAPATDGGGGGGSAVTLPQFAPPDIVNFVPPPTGISTIGLEDVFHTVPTMNPGAKPGPTTGSGDGIGEPGSFVSYTKGPELLNRPEILRLMERNYPRILLDAGVGGAVTVWLRIDTSGNVLETRVSKASGQETLDQAALRVGKSMRFSPAMNRDVPVQVWVEIPVVFSARE